MVVGIRANSVSAAGHATARAPSPGWDPEAKDLAVYFATSFEPTPRTATRALPASTSSSTPPPPSPSKSKAGPIAGGVIGSLAFLTSLVALVLFLLRRHKRAQSPKPSSSDSPLAMTQSPSMHPSTSPVSPGTGTLSSAIMHPLPYSPEGSPVPPGTPWHGISSVYYRQAHSPPPYAQRGGWGEHGQQEQGGWYPQEGTKGWATSGMPVELEGSEGGAGSEVGGGELEAPRAVGKPGFI